MYFYPTSCKRYIPEGAIGCVTGIKKGTFHHKVFKLVNYTCYMRFNIIFTHFSSLRVHTVYCILGLFAGGLVIGIAFLSQFLGQTVLQVNKNYDL